MVASVARELLNKSENERSGVVSTAMSFLGLYRDPIVAAATARSDWRIADLIDPARPVSLYLVVPPSDISRTRPLVRLILNQIARRLTEKLQALGSAAPSKGRLLLMLDEFPALGRLEFFETALTFLAGYGVRAFLVAQSLNQIEKAYGPNNAILDNCHVRVAFAPNDERTARRLSDALGTMTEQRAQRNLAGHRLSPWLSHLAVSSQETPRPLMTPGEVLQLPADAALVLVSGTPPIRARKLAYYTDRNFTMRCLPPPALVRTDRTNSDDWSGRMRATDARLEQPWSDLVSSAGRTPEMTPPHERAPELSDAHADLDLLRDDDAGGPSACGRRRDHQPCQRRRSRSSALKAPMKQRLTLYLTPEAADRLNLVANYRKGAKSALVEEALGRYLNPERNRLLDDAVLRRLDGLTRSVGVVARDVAIATETLSLFVRYFLTITPPLPQAEQDAARALGRQRFEVFVAQVGRRLGSDHRLVSEVLESIAAHNPDLFATATDDAPLKPAAPERKPDPVSTAREWSWLISSPLPPSRRRDAGARCCAPPSARPSAPPLPIRT